MVAHVDQNMKSGPGGEGLFATRQEQASNDVWCFELLTSIDISSAEEHSWLTASFEDGLTISSVKGTQLANFL